MAGLRPVVNDQQLTVLRVLGDRRWPLGEDHTRMVSQLHQLLLEPDPRRGEEATWSAAQAKALLAKVRPRDVAGKTRRRVAAEPDRRPGTDLRPQEGRQPGASRNWSLPPAPV